MSSGLGITLVALYVVLEMLAKGGITRLLFRLVAVLFIHVELLAVRVVRLVHPPRFVLGGQCHKRGVCCTQILGDPPRLIKASRLLDLWLWMHRVLHNFHPVARGPNGEVIFSCGYLQPNGRCGIYHFRPLICRDYPVLPYYREPAILPGCGFIAVPRVVSTMQGRPSLPVLNAFVAVHHPTPTERDVDIEEHYELVDEEATRTKPA